MCAIAGLIDKKNILSENQKREVADGFIVTLSHRGGDGGGILIKDNIVMTHNRLAVVDLTKNSNQPVSDDGYALSYNGEIYNYKDLGSEKLKSDTQFLFKYLKEGFDINDLDGMFAYSFVDYNNNLLNLQVDRFGIKPLYYFENEDYFIWSSEIKAIKTVPGVSFKFNEEALSEYMMFKSIGSHQTLIKNVYRVLPGECITVNIKNLEKNKIQSIKALVGKNVYDKSESDIFNIIEKSVKRCLLSDTAVGVQLSGGIDSSLIALISSKYLPNINTYSIGMENDKWNEFNYSRLISEKINSKHKEILFSKIDLINNFEKVTYLLDEPICHANTVPLYLLAREARKEVKVLMTGEGIDEILGGYKRYSKLENEQDFNIVNSQKDISKLLNNYISDHRSSIFKAIKEDDILKRYCKYDVLTFLPGVLVRQDKSSMGGNIESRVPFLSNDISNLLFNLKTSFKVGRFGSKNILKEILFNRFNLPFDFITREKCGFGLPISEWLKDEEVFLPIVMSIPEHYLIKNYFNLDEIETLIKQHINSESDNSKILFTIVSLITWYDIFIGLKSESLSQDVFI